MRFTRLAFVLTAVYLALIGGTYYYQFFTIRVLHHAVITLLVIVWLARRVRHGLPTTPLNLLLVMLIGVWALSAVFSLDPRSAFENLWFPLTHLVLFLIIADMIGRGREKVLIETFFLVGTIIMLLALAQLVAWYTGIDLMLEGGVGWLNVGMILPPETPMIFIPLGVSTWLAAFAAATSVFTFGWGLSLANRGYRIAFFVLAAAMLLVLIGTFSRGGFIGFAVGVSALIGLYVLNALLPRASTSPSASRSQAVKVFPLVIIAGVVVASVIGLIVLIGRSESRSTGDNLRFGLWGGSVSMIWSDPLTGVGPGLFGRAYREIRDPRSVDDRLSTAHNAYLNNAAETGIFGILVMIGFAFVIVARWWILWRRAGNRVRQRRLGAALAALAAFSVQSVFDTFVITPLVLLSLVLIAYCIIEPGSLRSNTPSRWSRVTAVGLALVFAVYGIAFIQFDRAQALFHDSVRTGDLAAAQEAAALDPHLNLYQLQVAYLIGQGDDLGAAVAAYESALALEPTWETGWINLGALREQQGDIEGALSALVRAANIRREGLGYLNWARIAEAHAAAPDDLIVERYYAAALPHYLPLSDFWVQTDLRREALTRYMHDESLPLSWRYRVAALRDAAYAASLVPQNPVTAFDWWVVGEHTLNMLDDPQAAAGAFTEAVRLEPSNGDYYVARARAELSFDESAARHDLDIADMLITKYEHPNAVRIMLASTPDEVRQWRAAAVPLRIIDQNFEGVLYHGRVGTFDVFPIMRYPGYGTAVLQPWYDLAAAYESAGQTAAAINVYRAILDAAPAEAPAAEAVARLQS